MKMGKDGSIIILSVHGNVQLGTAGLCFNVQETTQLFSTAKLSNTLTELPVVN